MHLSYLSCPWLSYDGLARLRRDRNGGRNQEETVFKKQGVTSHDQTLCSTANGLALCNRNSLTDDYALDRNQGAHTFDTRATNAHRALYVYDELRECATQAKDACGSVCPHLVLHPPLGINPEDHSLIPYTHPSPNSPSHNTLSQSTMNPWGTAWQPQPNWYQQPHPHIYIPPQPQFAQPPNYWEDRYGGGWNSTAAQQHGELVLPLGIRYQSSPFTSIIADGFRSHKYPNLNPILAADTTLLRYDIRKKPRDIILATTYFQSCHTPALAHHCSHVRLISKAFPWTIEVKSNQASITCELIWDSIYHALQEPLADSEWGMVVTDKATRERVEKAAKKRQEIDKDNRLKRIDLLGETTLFKGLEKDEEYEKLRLLPRASNCSETWVVRLSSGL